MYIWEELLLADSLEKIIRMESYLYDVELQACEDEIKIVEYYKNVIKTKKNQLENSANWLKTYHGSEIDKEISTICIKNCLAVSLSVQTIHNEFLSYLPSLKTRAETYTFLKNLLQQTITIESEDIKPTIVLIDDMYNYEERNITQGLKDLGIIEAEIGEQIIIGLPKIEKDNPLMWTILAHEIGHVLIDKYLKNLNDTIIRTLTDKKIETNHLPILKDWIIEIISDILSVGIMGPSYLYSYIFFNLLNNNLDEFSKSHPPPRYRISIMMSVLEKKRFELAYIKELYELVQRRSLIYLNSGDIYCQICETKIASVSDIEEIKKEFCQLIDFAIGISYNIKVKEYTPNDILRCEKMVDNLKDFIPVSSSRKMNNNELNEAVLFFKAGRVIASFDNEKTDVYTLLGVVTK